MSLHHFTAGIPHCSRVRTPTADHQIKVRGRGMIRRAEKQIFALHTLPFHFTISSPMFFLCDWVDIFYLFRTAKLQNKEKSFNNSLTLCKQCGPQAKKVWTIEWVLFNLLNNHRFKIFLSNMNAAIVSGCLHFHYRRLYIFVSSSADDVNIKTFTADFNMAGGEAAAVISAVSFHIPPCSIFEPLFC